MSEPIYCDFCDEEIKNWSSIKAIRLESTPNITSIRYNICGNCYEMIDNFLSKLTSLSPPYHTALEARKRIVMSLHKKGYSIRQIQGLLDYKSPRSVHRIIHDTKKKGD
jgi:hypothetical protein